MKKINQIAKEIENRIREEASCVEIDKTIDGSVTTLEIVIADGIELSVMIIDGEVSICGNGTRFNTTDAELDDIVAVYNIVKEY